jgi:hypothetical protein
VSYDSEPERRHLLYHPESDCLFVEYHLGRVEELLDTGEVEDVTDIKQYEDRYKANRQEVEG